MRRALRRSRGFGSFPIALFLIICASGCASTGEPAQAFTPIGPLAYDFKTVWEAASESLQQEGYPVDISDRTGGDEGSMCSRVVEAGTPDVHGRQEGRRCRARVEKLAQKKFKLWLAASRFERNCPPVSSGGQPSEWEYIGRDEELLSRLRARVDKNIERRYRPSEGG